MSCPRCNGSILQLDTDGLGCLQCGYRPRPHADDLPRMYSPKTAATRTTFGNSDHKNHQPASVSVEDIRDAMKAHLYEAHR